MSSRCSRGSSVMMIITASVRGCSSFSTESMPGSRENISYIFSPPEGVSYFTS